MSVRQGILALLSERPMHGYQLRQEFESRTGGTWPLNIGQAYTTLQRLARDGLVEPVPADDAEAPERFRLTAPGRAEADGWWTRPVPRTAPTRDELAIKLALAVTVPGVDLTAVVQQQRTETLRALRDYTRLKRDAASEPDGLAWSLVLESLIFAAEAEARWLDHVESTVTRAATQRAATTSAVPDGGTPARPEPAPSEAPDAGTAVGHDGSAR
ncbi:PadR family transcriptional regulator [Isoptericola croceus]|uniref:PadR family transcriptional regulator n=1 Tax=Isoptericola croceus TaxID=3031406 RepID=UPI0023F824E0|nr:PadR family transcriptional regulator [Isoptericola croceus]